MREYNHKQIEKKWQKKWSEDKLYKTPESSDKPKYYILDMFPYPSGEGLHVGHPKGYIATDVMSRHKRMSGFNVLHPMGWDAFGLPAENYAIKNKVHPREAVEKNVERFKEQLSVIGFDYDWEREINTTDPNYYKWTQWIFLQLYKKGLAFESHEPINWCPSCKTGLANEDLEGGNCERCESEVEQKPMRQWVLKIKEYAQRLLDDVDQLNWPHSIKALQKNWIGRSEGINLHYKVDEVDEELVCFTTRPDTNFGATFLVVAPEHPFIAKYIKAFPKKDAVSKYVDESKKKTELQRMENKTKTGAATGWYVTNPLNNRKLEIYVGDFVLAHVGTGAVVGVPGHDDRDFEFAQAMNIDVVRVVISSDGDTSEIITLDQVQEHEGTMINSDFLNGMEIMEAKEAIMDHIVKDGWGERVVNYKLKDWVFSRQRYWGEPIPIIHCEKCGAVPVPEDQLPVLLPDVQSYEPTGTGESPLAGIGEWVNTECPECGGEGKRETNTMPQWAGSSWYYLRYADNANTEACIDPEKDKYWQPVDMYVGGAEHATRHLIYARFWHKFLFDIGVVHNDEPFMRLQHVGLINAEDGRKMSKRWGNVINPDDVVAQYGADTLRMYTMFLGPFDQSVSWSTESIIGPRRFLERVWRLQEGVSDSFEDSKEVITKLHQMIKKVGTDIETMAFNTAISEMMTFAKLLETEKEFSRQTYTTFLTILAPFAPHMTEDVWEELGERESIHTQEWPKYDDNLTQEDQVTLAIQVNGKIRDEITVDNIISEDGLKEKVLKQELVQKWLEGKEIKKFIYVPGRLISIVTA